MSSSSSNSTAPPPDSNSDSGSGSSPPPPSDSDSGSGSESSPSTPLPPPPPQSSKGSPPSPQASKNNNKIPSPPPPPSKSSHNSPSSGSSIGLSDQHQKVLIGGCIVAGVVIVALIIICLTCCRRKKKKNMHGYYGEYHHGGNGQFYDGAQQSNWHNTPSRTEHGMKLSSQQGGGWNGPPAPFPQPPTYNSDISSNYSGPRRPPLPPPSPNAVLGFNQSTFTYDDLAVATGGFSQDMLLGQGGFGYVHKGVLPNGKEIAVKSLKSGSGQGEREFQAEVDIISRVHHRHLVSLVGYCIAGSQRMLVYEFVPNKTLEYHLHGKDLPVMDWPTRLRIALGSAKGLAYLHEDCHPKIIHRDIKSANILLDFKFEAMVADFGLAKLSSDTNTHVSTRVMGTFGYLAPEYASSGKLTEKSDVFSFGVMLLELITGNRPVDPKGAEDSMVEWARPLLTRAMEEGVYHELVDLRLDNNFNPQEMQRMISCASASIRHSAKRRPKMSQVVRVLEGDVVLDDLNELQRTGTSSLFGGSNGSSDLDTPNYDTAMYNTDMKRFRQVALSSQEFGSSEHSSGNSPKPNF